jgi:hypothetical protein
MKISVKDLEAYECLFDEFKKYKKITRFYTIIELLKYTIITMTIVFL